VTTAPKSVIDINCTLEKLLVIPEGLQQLLNVFENALLLLWYVQINANWWNLFFFNIFENNKQQNELNAYFCHATNFLPAFSNTILNTTLKFHFH